MFVTLWSSVLAVLVTFTKHQCVVHRDTYIEQQQTEKLETGVRDFEIGYESRK